MADLLDYKYIMKIRILENSPLCIHFHFSLFCSALNCPLMMSFNQTLSNLLGY